MEPIYEYKGFRIEAIEALETEPKRVRVSVPVVGEASHGEAYIELSDIEVRAMLACAWDTMLNLTEAMLRLSRANEDRMEVIEDRTGACGG